MSKEMVLNPIGIGLIDFIRQKNRPVSGTVFFLNDKPNQHLVVTYFNQAEDRAYDGSYYRYDMDYVTFNNVKDGKRGAKVKRVYIDDLSSMRDEKRSAVSASNITVIGQVKLRHLPKVVKVVEEEGWALK